MTPCTLLIDADVLLWRAASAVQRTFDFGGGVFATGADFANARDKLDQEVRELVVKLRATRIVLALSDPKRNWRKEVLPTYKANRGHAKPKVFWQLREHAEATYDTRWFPGLEGDDVLGLYATGTSIKGKKIVVSIDKDLQTVPCLLYNPNKPERGTRKIGEAEADEYHFMQTLTGDAVDGYSGCPGVGSKRAAKLLHGCVTDSARWLTIVNAYLAKGLTEEDALVQARVARILRRGEYDKETYRVTLWQPPSTIPPCTQSSASTASKTPASAKTSPPAPAATRTRAKVGRTSSRRSSSNASRSTSRTARRSTGTTTGRRGSPCRGTTRPRSGTS